MMLSVRGYILSQSGHSFCAAVRRPRHTERNPSAMGKATGATLNKNADAFVQRLYVYFRGTKTCSEKRSGIKCNAHDDDDDNNKIHRTPRARTKD